MKLRLFFSFAFMVALCAACVEIPDNQEEETNAVESLSVVPGQVELEEGQTLQLETVLRPEGVEAKVSWSVLKSATSQEGVVTVNANGLVTALKPGYAEVEAKSGKAADICYISVTAKPRPAEKVEFEKSSYEVIKGGKVSIGAIVTPENATNNHLDWTSSDEKIATVEAYGTVTGIAAGTATIRATITGTELFAECQVEVKIVPVESVSIDVEKLDLEIGKTASIVVTVLPESAREDNPVSFSSKNDKVASVDAAGVVTAVGEGQTEITATAGDKSASCPVVVTVPVVDVESIAFAVETFVFAVGQVDSLKVQFTPAEAAFSNKVSFTSSNPDIVEVKDNNLLDAKAEGEVTITATAQGIIATCKLTVGEWSDNGIDMGLESGIRWATYNIGANKMSDYGDYIAWGEIQKKNSYSWSNYKWGTAEDAMTKYVFCSHYGAVDNVDTLVPEDDAAHVRWGEKWRMPTLEEFKELLAACNTSRAQKGDVYGLLFTSKTNGARLFLPQANSSIGGNANYYGNYWTSNVNSSPTGQSYRAHYYTFTNGQRGYMAQYERYAGMTIRPVWDPKL